LEWIALAIRGLDGLADLSHIDELAAKNKEITRSDAYIPTKWPTLAKPGLVLRVFRRR
jgi:hypothetical protein